LEKEGKRTRKSFKGKIVLQIRCDRDTFLRFKRFASEFRNYEEALIELLENYKPMRFL